MKEVDRPPSGEQGPNRHVRKDIQCLHPQGKKGVRIDRAKYDPIREAILAVLEAEGPCRFMRLAERVEERLGDNFPGSVSWYTITVKLDLEARGVVERVRQGGADLVAFPADCSATGP
ncbi:MAG: hypothetical protein F4Y37_01440 [Caldilineaceae bacterium SB0664_bin_22]|nr:hypothetical protein [Caldilineaceae bacterium SB0664_bin_22]